MKKLVFILIMVSIIRLAYCQPADADPNSPVTLADYLCIAATNIVKDTAGTCDNCGMALVTTESLGYVPVDNDQLPPLVLPASAVLNGKRAVVYVQVPDTEKPTFEGHEIVLGPRAGGPLYCSRRSRRK